MVFANHISPRYIRDPAFRDLNRRTGRSQTGKQQSRPKRKTPITRALSECLPPWDISIALRTHTLGRHQRDRDRAHEHPRTSQVQGTIQALGEQFCRDERGHDAEEATPEAGDPAGGAADGRGERLGRPAVEDGVEHGLEEVLHHVQADVGGLRVDGREEEEGDAHERG